MRNAPLALWWGDCTQLEKKSQKFSVSRVRDRWWFRDGKPPRDTRQTALNKLGKTGGLRKHGMTYRPCHSLGNCEHYTLRQSGG